jgi:hypothetical protein
MAYATLAQMRQILNQVTWTADNDALMTACLDRASALVDAELGFSLATYGLAAARDIESRTCGQKLFLPPFKPASVTIVAELYSKGTTGEYTVGLTDYDELDGYLLYRYAGWEAGWYRITAIWGHGTTPVLVEQVTLEVAVNLWQSNARGMFTDSVGVEGGGTTGPARYLTWGQKDALRAVRVQYDQFGFA